MDVLAEAFSEMTATPNHALQRTAPRVTLAAAHHPAASAHPAPAMSPQPARRAPQSLSLGSLGVARAPYFAKITTTNAPDTMKTTILLALALAGIQPASAEFSNHSGFRGVSLYVDGDPGPIDVFGNPVGLFDPLTLSISDSSMGGGFVNASINHQSNISFGPTSLAASLSDTGAGISEPAEGTRGTLSAVSQLQLGFTSDTPFTFTLTANLSGLSGNGFLAGVHGVRFSDSYTTLAFYDLANPSGTSTWELPAGNYFLDSVSGMSFDAIFGVPPAPSYNSPFASDWNFSATPTPEPSSAILLLSGAALCLRRRSLRTNARNA